MSSCDICGRPAGLRAIVEGAELSVCNACSPFGKITSAPAATPRAAPAKKPQTEEMGLAQGFGRAIQEAREKAGYDRQQLAQKLNMREADLRHFEEEKIKPRESEARKLESMLKIVLITATREEPAPVQRKTNALTLGDVVVIKDKRK